MSKYDRAAWEEMNRHRVARGATAISWEDYTDPLARSAIATSESDEYDLDDVFGTPASNGTPPRGTTPRIRFTLETFSELTVENGTVEYLVDPIISEQSLTMFFGAPGVGKSFLVQWLCLCVALGIPFFGRAVRRAQVLYAAAEGITGMPGRFRALAQALGVEDVPDLRFLRRPVDLLDGDSRQALLDACAPGEFDPGLIVFDTLQAHSPPGFNESETQNMNGMCGAARIIMAELGAAFVFLHHPGHDLSRPRGSSVIGGTVDHLYAVETAGEKAFTVRSRKQRDGADPPPFTLRIVPFNESCILEPAERTITLTPFQSRQLQELAAGPLTWGEWRKATGHAKSTFNSILAELKQDGHIQQESKSKCYVITDHGLQALGTRYTAGPSEVRAYPGVQGTWGTPVSRQAYLVPTPTPGLNGKGHL